MTHISRPHTLIGYQHGQIPPGANSFPGTATIEGVLVTHQLSICVEPVSAIDLGRSPDGDLVWVSEFVEAAEVRPETPSIFLPHNFTPAAPNSTHESTQLEDFWVKPERFAVVSKYRKPILFGSGALIVAVTFCLFLPSESSSSQVTEIPSETSKEVSANSHVEDTNTKPQDPASAAIDFVVNGEVDGVVIEPGTQASDFQANVVSQSGEIVLVDVLSNEASGLTTFATLLLQKSGTAWRIREVFDPR